MTFLLCPRPNFKPLLLERVPRIFASSARECMQRVVSLEKMSYVTQFSTSLLSLAHFEL